MTDYGSLPLREAERLARNIHPGEWAVEKDRPISTLLGSCVAVCLIDTGVPIAGMNHFLLPNIADGRNSDDDVQLAGDACMTALINAILSRGAARHRLQAKAFGGGTVIDCSNSSLTVGMRNAQFTREWLELEGIPLVASDFLGPWARKVVLFPDSGDAYCKRMTSNLMASETIRREEENYVRSLSHYAGTGKKVELF
jgi:chemotaxis protein CheD